jgi:hypothetical protein
MLNRADRLGRTEAYDRGASPTIRKISIEVVIPGLAGDLAAPDEARFEFEEWWRRTTLGWVRVRYNYNAFDLVRGGSWGFHLHPLDRRTGEAVPHAVCTQRGGSGRGRHFEAHEVDLLAAHEAFERWYARGEPIDCGELTPID